MKIFLKYSFLAILFFAISCGNTAAEKEKIVKKEQPVLNETKPVIVEEKPAKAVAIKQDNTEKKMVKPGEVEQSIVERKKPTRENKPAKPKTDGMKKVVEKEATSTKEEKSKPVEMPAAEITKAKPVETKVEKTPVAAEKEITKTETATAPKEASKPTAPEFSHDAWNKLLQANVSSTGKVNYKGFKADKSFDAYLEALADNPVKSSDSKAEKMAYWINAYNAFTIKLIVDNYPVSSITKLHGGKPWDVKWIKLGDKTYSLNNIEHDILRPQYKDARIHFAVNCAAKSCPPVLNKAWTAKNLNSNLERSAKKFINNTTYNTISAKEVTISKIFDWYGEDFGDIISYLNKYSDTKIDAGATVKYQDYNWALNE